MYAVVAAVIAAAGFVHSNRAVFCVLQRCREEKVCVLACTSVGVRFVVLVMRAPLRGRQTPPFYARARKNTTYYVKGAEIRGS